MVIDIICLVLAAYGFYLGYTKGIIETILNIVSWAFGIMAAFKFTSVTTKVLENVFNNHNPLMFVAGFVVSFVLMMLIIRLIGKGLTEILEGLQIDLINSMLGGIANAGFFVLLLSIMLWFGAQAQIITETTTAGSLTYRFLEPLPARAKQITIFFKPTVTEFWQESMHVMDKMQRASIEKVEGSADIYDIDEEKKENTDVEVEEESQ